MEIESDGNILLQNQKDDSGLMIAIFDAAGSVPPPQKDGETVQQDGQAKGFFSSFVHVYDTGTEVAALRKAYMDTCDPFDFLNLPTKDNLISALSKITPLLESDAPVDEEFFKIVDNSAWLTYVSDVLHLVGRLVRKMKGETILIQNGGPESDMDSTLVCLILLSCDSYYRTLRGFCTLLQKEWISYSHRWSETSPTSATAAPPPGASSGGGGTSGTREERRNIDVSFVFFLNCVAEMIQQRPTWFEFTDELLLFLAEAAHSYRFSSFFFDSESDRQHALPDSSFPSVWQYVLGKDSVSRFTHAYYVAPSRFQLLVLGDDFQAAWWGRYFWRHSMTVMFARTAVDEKLRDIEADYRAKRLGSGDTDKLHVVSIVTTQFTTFGSEWCKLTYMTTLVLQANRLTTIPIEIGALVNLEHLRLQLNHISFVSNIIGERLTNLKTLNLAQNRITGFADNLGSLTQLTGFNLQNNRLTAIPPSFCSLTSLKSLNLNQNKLTKLPGSAYPPPLPPSSIFSLTSQFSNLVSLEKLELHNNELLALPGSHVSALLRLETLSLSGNNLVVVPDALGLLTRLHTLDLTVSPYFTLSIFHPHPLIINRQDNRLAAVPEGIGGCVSLLVLNISSNSSIKRLPDAIGKLTRLESLECGNCGLEYLPVTIGGLTSLSRLMLSRNKLTDLPITIKHLKNVRDINVSHNQLDSASHGLGQCSSLETLDLSNNQIVELPATLSHLLGTLKRLVVDNTIVTPPPEIMAKGVDAQLSFLKDLLEDSESVYRSVPSPPAFSLLVSTLANY